MSITPLVMGNWKMNGRADQLHDFLATVKQPAGAEVALCPPAVYLQQCIDSPVGIGAQDVSAEQDGARTGELSAPMLSDVGCKYVLVGHSERREYHAESNELVAAKAAAAVAEGLIPIFCVGETLAQREAGEVEAVIAQQLEPLLANIDVAEKTVVAYEPVWAIGTGKTASSEDAQQVHAYIRTQFDAVNGRIAAALRILYGGSVKPENAGELCAMPDINGALVGGASLDAASFNEIIQAAADTATA